MRWADAVELGAQGRYGQAREILESIPDGHRWRSLALSTLASHRRQVGAAEPELDRAALERAVDIESRADALIGLAADGVAAGNVAQAAEHLVEAQALVEADAHLGEDGSWRWVTRWYWVSAELALLRGDPVAAGEEARAARRTCAGHSVRHEAKSVLIAMAAGDRFALSQAAVVADVLRRHGWASLQWPLALILEDARSRYDVPEDLWSRARQEALGAIDRITADLPPDLVGAWRSHPGVRRIQGAWADR